MYILCPQPISKLYLPDVAHTALLYRPCLLPWSGFLVVFTAAMAPIEDASVDALRDLVRKLETRVEQLESKLEQTTGGGSTRKQKATAGIRMILMGPPGAGIVR